MKTLDYSFSIKDADRTRQTHAAQMQKAADVINKELFSYPVNFNNISGEAERFLQSPQCRLSTRKSPQAKLNQYKLMINDYYQVRIYGWLKMYELPTSWTTAVYMLRYQEFNEFMSKIAQVVFALYEGDAAK